MERKEFKRRLSGLFAWMLVMILVVNNTQGGRISVHAEDVTGSSQVKQIEVPVTYYDIYSADDPSKSVLISQTANENGAIITSSEYSESVILNEYDSTLMQTDIQLPVAEKEGYILAGWELYGCDYVEADMPEESFWDVSVAASEIEAFAFVAVWVEALRNTITYDFTGATMNGVADTFSYEIVQPDADTYEFVENVTTLIPTMPGKVFTGWTPAETDKNIYDAQAGTITGTYGEGGDSTLYANWRDEGTITVEYLISDYYSDWGELGDDIVPVTFYEGETAEPVITLPLPIPFEGYAFRSWSCVDENAGQYLTDLLGYNEEIDGYPAGTVFRPEYTVDESTGNVNQAYSMYASFTTAEYLTVLYDLNGGQGLESTEDIVSLSLKQ